MHSRKLPCARIVLCALPLLLAILNPLSLPAQAAVSRMTVKITGLRNANGNVKILLWMGKDGFPGDATKALRRATVVIQNGTATTAFPGLAYGEYAISAYHDENNNGKMDTRFPGIPVEGVGVSNDPHKKFGPPSYSACRFSVHDPEETISIALEY